MSILEFYNIFVFLFMFGSLWEFNDLDLALANAYHSFDTGNWDFDKNP